MASQRVLYISYDGMLEPLGQSQVISYLERLSSEFQPVLISFEKRQDRSDRARYLVLRDRLKAAGIVWVPLTYHKAPSAPATAYDVAVGTIVAIVLARYHRVRIVHARSYVAGLVALVVKRVIGVPFLFDMRGFWVDERVDGGLWPRGGRLYRLAKRLEHHLLLAADHIVTLTNASQQELIKFPALHGSAVPISVIPTCANLDRFIPQGDPDPGLTIGYVGSFGTWYLLDETMCFFKILRALRPNAKLLIVNRGEHAQIMMAAKRNGVDPGLVELRSATHEEVPAYLRRMHATTAFIAPHYSKIASAPTKLAESLGCGVPCVGNAGVGDMAGILASDRVGVVIRAFDADAYAEAAKRLFSLLQDPDLKARCVSVARKRFSLDTGTASYRKIYRQLTAPTQPQRIAVAKRESKT